MTESTSSAQSRGSFGRALGAFFSFLLRFLFVLVVGTLLGLGLYYGVPALYRSWVLPVRKNTARVAALEFRLDHEQTQRQEEDLAMQTRVAKLEIAMTELQETSSVYAKDIAGMATRINELERSVAQTQESLDEGLALVRKDFDADLSTTNKEIEALVKNWERWRPSVEDALVTAESRADELSEQTMALGGQLALLRAAQDLLKIRLLLLEENPRAARDVVNLAVEHLDQAIGLLPDRAEALAALRERVVALDGLIAGRSFRVTPELEALWADMMELAGPQEALIEEEQGEALETPAPLISPVATPTPAP